MSAPPPERLSWWNDEAPWQVYSDEPKKKRWSRWRGPRSKARAKAPSSAKNMGDLLKEKSTWEEFFDAHAPVYEDNVFTKNTIREVDFLIEELSLPPGGSILDIGCGTGRHSIELAKRGYSVTGLDLSSEMLARAAASAKAAGVNVNWIRSDATHFSLPERYDGAICLCEGAFGLLGQKDDPIGQPLSILSNISRSLKPEAKAVLTVLNGAAMLRRSTNDDVSEGRFDPLTMVWSSEHPPREGLPPVPIRERAFMPTELILLFRLAGLSVLNLWGGTAGNWGKRTLDLDEIEIMIVARKTAEPSDAGEFDFVPEVIPAPTDVYVELKLAGSWHDI